MKTCSRCKVEKALDEFSFENRAKNIRKSACKPCYREQHAAWREQNKDRIQELWRDATKRHLEKKGWRWKAYKITDAEYQAWVEELDGCCTICRTPAPLVIDHDHDTGIVRGLLCDPCNKGLGFFRDSVDNLKTAVAYLEDHAGRTPVGHSGS